MTTEIISRLNTALEGRYHLERELGAGGMATVYLARDVRHDRQVALKVLRPELAAILGAERFLQEIKTTANLQHPHILPLHDSGEAGGSVFYVMPYVEGESLRDRLEREKHLPIDDAVRIAREIAGALDYAHRHGVVHRDIKPENILLHDGQALVADFGIALAVSRSDGGTRMTETGMSLGTPHYMSPEQAMGQREITPRSDVYALGCITYEMLSGDPPFTGSTAQAIVARVVTEKPRQLTLQRHTVPLHVEAAVFKALEKLPADRFATAAEFAEALINPAATASRTAALPATGMDRRWRRIALGCGALAAVAVTGALWGWLRPTPGLPVVRYQLGIPQEQGMQFNAVGVNLALSADGTRFVYLGPGGRGGQLWLRDRSRLEATPLPGTDAATNPVFSPDGRRIAFSAGGTFFLKVMAVDGGPSVTLTEAGLGGGLAWSEDGWIYFDTPQGLSRMRASGGDTQLVVPLDTTRGELGHAWPNVIPGGRRLLFRSRRNFDTDDFAIVVADLGSGARHVLTRGLWARFIEPGYLLFARADGALMAAPFHANDTALRGTATPLVEGVSVKPPWGTLDLAVSATGTLMYVPGSAATGSAGEVVWVTRDGGVSPLVPSLPVNPSPNRSLALSPDGTRLAIDAVGPRSVDIWIKQLPTGPLSRLTFEGSDNSRPSWSADGRTVYYISNRDSALAGVWRQRADGSAPADRVLQSRSPVYEAAPSRDGRWLVFRTNTGANRDVYGLRLGQDTTPVPLLTSRFNEYSHALSPDGTHLAYVSDESGTAEVFVRPFPNTADARWQISSGGGGPPRWAHSGRELFFENGASELVSVPVSTRPTFSAGDARRLFSLTPSLWPSNIVPYFDVSPDDRRFLMVRGGVSQTPGGGQIVVVDNWFQELRAKVEAGQR